MSQSVQERLRPCPFCGRTNVAQGASRDFISVWCTCGARGPDVPFPQDCDPLPPILKCYEAWNRRTPDTAALLDQAEARERELVEGLSKHLTVAFAKGLGAAIKIAEEAVTLCPDNLSGPAGIRALINTLQATLDSDLLQRREAE